MNGDTTIHMYPKNIDKYIRLICTETSDKSFVLLYFCSPIDVKCRPELLSNMAVKYD